MEYPGCCSYKKDLFVNVHILWSRNARIIYVHVVTLERRQLIKKNRLKRMKWFPTRLLWEKIHITDDFTQDNSDHHQHSGYCMLRKKEIHVYYRIYAIIFTIPKRPSTRTYFIRILQKKLFCRVLKLVTSLRKYSSWPCFGKVLKSQHLCVSRIEYSGCWFDDHL